ncbi:MAG TPA: aminodeoxychorismate synthase component I [Gammaproteobacteria bacterium]|nr:aminodeoxychorismate synthase component I [Gammaproteobacteria bacterium]
MFQEISYQSPLAIFALFAEKEGAVLLDSAQLRKNCGRYSFIAIDPFLMLKSKNGLIQLGEKSFSGNPFDVLAEQLKKFHQENVKELPPFQGGAAGFLSYELAHHLEKLPFAKKDDMQFPDMALGFYDLVIGFDESEKRAWIFSNGFPEQDFLKREHRAKQRMNWLLKQIADANLSQNVPDRLQEKDIKSNFTCKKYQDAVKKVINYVLAGDIFEANISQRFQVELPLDFSTFNLYRTLHALNPAPFAAYLYLADTVLVSASPERFLSLKEKHVETRPIKGTRPRGKNLFEDKKFSEELLMSEKDHAENVMIVDLLRNDLSRVCEDYSVKVPELCRLESYATVHHLVSIVTGQLCKNFTAVDLLKATFPGGSITGAPKIRAMEIIAEIEPNARGPYCGSIGYIGFNGDMDMSITIRTFAIKNNIATFQAGGAIVADSIPLAEYEETLDKARALRRSLI